MPIYYGGHLWHSKLFWQHRVSIGIGHFYEYLVLLYVPWDIRTAVPGSVEHQPFCRRRAKYSVSALLFTVLQYMPANKKHLLGVSLRLLFVAQGPGHFRIFAFLSTGGIETCFIIWHFHIFARYPERVPLDSNSLWRGVLRVARFTASRHQQAPAAS